MPAINEHKTNVSYKIVKNTSEKHMYSKLELFLLGAEFSNRTTIIRRGAAVSTKALYTNLGRRPVILNEGVSCEAVVTTYKTICTAS
jgi:hypothetical protein